MKKHNIFKIAYPNTPPVYVFTKNGWCGLASNIQLRKDECGMIYPLTYWQFIKEWLHGNKRT